MVNKKILLFISLALILVLSLNFISSALSIITDTNYEKSFKGYPEISLKNYLGLPLISEEIFKGNIESHTESCSSNCESTIKVLVKGGLSY